MKIEITPELLANLKEKAEKATPGPWKLYNDDSVGYVELAYDPPKKDRVHDWSNNLPEFVCDFDDGEYHQYKSIKEANANASFVAAANPAIMLALITRIEELESENNALGQLIDDEYKINP